MMDASQSPVADEERPAKRARLDAPASPPASPWAASDAAFDDDDDLYDTPPSQPLTAQVSANAKLETSTSPAISGSIPQPGGIPGLGLLGSAATRVEDGPLQQTKDYEHSVGQEASNSNAQVEDERTYHGEAMSSVEERSHTAAANETNESENRLAVPNNDDSDDASSYEEAILGVAKPESKPAVEKRLMSSLASFEDDGPSRREELGNGFPNVDEDDENLSHTSGVAGLASIPNGKGGNEADSSVETDGPQIAQIHNDNEKAEWQFDSSDARSSDSSSDESNSDQESEEDEDEDEYQLLDPAEQARILMREHAEGDDGKENKANPNARPRTLNETDEPAPEKPNIQLPPDTSIEQLGTAERFVENHLIIRAMASGETQVPATGSLLCLENKLVIGVVAEPFGRVDDPHYSVMFSSEDDIAALGIEMGAKIFYVPSQSTYVFTQALKLMRGSDASNIHDEEVGAHEMEFSDDEAEAEYKRKIKQERAKKWDKPQPGGNTHVTAGRPDRQAVAGAEYPQAPIKYDDDDDEPDDLYTPLARPENLHSLPPRPPVRVGGFRGAGDRGPRSRGNFDRGRGGSRGSRGDRGNRGGRGAAYNEGSRGGRGGRGGTLNDRPYHRQDTGYDRSPPALQIPNHESSQYGNTARADNSSSPQNHSRRNAQYYSQPASSPQANFPRDNQYYAQPASSPPAVISIPPSWQGQNQAGGYANSYNHSPPIQVPMTPGGSIPPGSFVNPAFFRNQGQGSPPFAYSPPPVSPQQSQWYPPYAAQGSNATPGKREESEYEEYDPTRPWI